MAVKRNATKNATSLEHRLTAEVARLRTQAEAAGPGKIRDGLLSQASGIEAGLSMNAWLASPLKPPT